MEAKIVTIRPLPTSGKKSDNKNEKIIQNLEIPYTHVIKYGNFNLHGNM